MRCPEITRSSLSQEENTSPMRQMCDSCSCQLPSLIYLGIKKEEQPNEKDNAIYHMPVDGRGHDPAVALGKSKAFLVIIAAVDRVP